MRHIIKLILSFLVFVWPLPLKSQVAGQLTVELKIESTELGAISPCSMRFIIKNVSSEIASIKELLIGGSGIYTGYLFLEYRKLESLSWSRKTLMHYHKGHSSGSQSLQIQPNDSIVTNELILPVYQIFGDIKTEDSFEIRTAYYPSGFNDTTLIIRSPIKKVWITKYTGEDAKCFNFLQTRAKPDFVYDAYYAHVSDGTIGVSQNLINDFYIKDADYILTNFPNSQFAEWAAFLLAHNYYNRASYLSSTEPEEALEYLRLFYKNKKFSLRSGNEKIRNIIEGYRAYQILLLIYDHGEIPRSVFEEFDFIK
ncbi:MAG: hypothetical protein R2792_10950 [Saprospiraceae bacterium]